MGFEIEGKTVDDLVAEILEVVDSGAMITKFAVLIEGMDSDGSRSIYMSTNHNATTWDNIGLLRYALAREEAMTVRDI